MSRDTTQKLTLLFTLLNLIVLAVGCYIEHQRYQVRKAQIEALEKELGIYR